MARLLPPTAAGRPIDSTTCFYKCRGNSGVLPCKLVEHHQYICTYLDDMPEIRNWKWTNKQGEPILTSYRADDN